MGKTFKSLERLPCAERCLYDLKCGEGLIQQKDPCETVLSGLAHRVKKGMQYPTVVMSAENPDVININGRYQYGREGEKRDLTMPTARRVIRGEFVRDILEK